MKTLLLLTIFGISLSLQEGYFHKQYEYKSSKSSYKNNELQHKSDDEEFSSVHGDLSGRNDPKVNAYTQHTEYRNPNSQEPIDSGFGGSTGRYQTQNLGYGTNPDDITGSISGQRKHISYSGTYTVSGGQGGSYDTQSRLSDLTQKVQNSLSSQLSRAISEQRRSGYGQHSSSFGVENEIKYLEDELRANLTKSLQEELNSQYGSQTQRGSYSYSGSQVQPNYNTQELEDLTQQVRTNLLDQLKREYKTTSSSSSTKSSSSYTSSGAHSYGNSYNQPIYSQPRYPTQEVSSSRDYSSRAHSTMYTTPTVRPSQQLVDVTSIAQNELDTILNRALTILKTKYMNDDVYKSYYQPDYDVILNDLTQELKQNVSTEVQSALRNAYGLQEEKNGYYFSTWNLNNNIANYKTEDLDNLKRQVEKNLLDKLTQEVRRQETSYSQKKTQYDTERRSQSQTNTWGSRPSDTSNNQFSTQYSSQSQFASSSSYGMGPYPSQNNPNQEPGGVNYHNVNRYPSNPTGSYPKTNFDQQQVEEIDLNKSNQRPGYIYPNNYQTNSNSYPSSSYPSNTNPTSSYPNTYPSNSHPSNTYPTNSYPPSSSSTSNSYSSSQSNRESTYQASRPQIESSSQLSSSEISRIDEELRADLNHQLQVLSQKQRDQEKYGSSHTVDLTEEFKQNFSRRVEQILREHGINGGYSFTIYSSGSSGGRISEEMLRLLMNDLLRQLREQLTASSTKSKTYTSNAKITFNPTYTYPAGYGVQSGGYNNYQMKSGYREVDYQQTEDCMQSDEATSTPKSVKPPKVRGDISAELEVAPLENKPKARDVVTTPKTSTNNDLNQQTRNLEQLTQDISKQLSDLTQKNQDFSQQTQDFSQQLENINKPTYFKPQHADLTQQTEDLSQQTQDFSQQLEKINKPTYFKPQHADLTQQTEDLTQQTEDLNQQTQDFRYFDQQTSDLTQKTEDLSQHSYTPLNHGLIQQTEEFPNQKPYERTQIAQVEEVSRIEQKPEEKIAETTTQAPGFWKKLGGKITSGFSSVKDKVQSIG